MTWLVILGALFASAIFSGAHFGAHSQAAWPNAWRW